MKYIVYAKFKKDSGDVIYSSNGVLTTCILDDPHFGFRYNKVKMVKNKVADHRARYILNLKVCRYLFICLLVFSQ